AEICSYRYVGSLRQSPCDKHEASIQRLHEYCLNNPFNSGCKDDDSYDDARHGYCLNDPFDSHRGCLSDDRYKNARFEKCKVDFRYECTHGGLEFYPLRIQFCNNPMNARYNSYKLCEVSYKPWVSHDGDTQSEFLQRGTKDGLNTGSLRASLSDATAPVVHTLKLSDSDDGVAFFSGIAPDRGQDRYYRTYYAGILPKNNLGAPITQTRGTATWQGTFSTINSATQTSDSFRTDKDFNLEIDFAKKQLSASISGIENKDKNNHLDADTRWTHTDYRLSGVFAEGKIEGYLHITTFLEGRDDSKSWTTPARVSGLIGQDGAVAAFVDGLGFHSSGGFVARPPSK
nr:hypothetical protein [Pseudomonadota bacterium]